jgi:hypothetical protein
VITFKANSTASGVIAVLLFSAFSLTVSALAQNQYSPGSPFVFKSSGSPDLNGPPAGQATFMQSAPSTSTAVSNGPPAGQATFMQPTNSLPPSYQQQQSSYGQQPTYQQPSNYGQQNYGAANGFPNDNRPQIRYMMRNRYSTGNEKPYLGPASPSGYPRLNPVAQMHAGGGIMDGALSSVDRSPISDVGSFLKEDFPLPPAADDATQFEMPALTQKAFSTMKKRTFRAQ